MAKALYSTAFFSAAAFNSAPVIGATKTAHLDEAVGAFAVSLTAEDVALIDEFYLPHKVMGALTP